jgi:hypothetical protein
MSRISFGLGASGWLTPVILAAQEVVIKRTAQAKKLARPYFEKPFTKKGWWSNSR